MACRYPEKHGCSFDFQSEGKEKLKKDNPHITTEKVIKI